MSEAIELVREPGGAYGLQTANIRGVVTIEEAKRQRRELKEFVSEIMEEDLDYGVIQGTKRKTLLKPGAEKLAGFFGLTKRLGITKEIEDWSGADHDGEPFFYYLYTCRLYLGDVLIAEADGSCNSWEKKYRYRQAERKCPSCGKQALIKVDVIFKDPTSGKQWLCHKKKEGCGAKFPENDREISTQEVGQVLNADIFDLVNTVQKQAAKRALVAGVTLACNASEFYTQDVEDLPEGLVEPDREHHSAPAGDSRSSSNAGPDPMTAFWMAVKAVPNLDGKALLAAHNGDPVAALSAIDGAVNREVKSREASKRPAQPEPAQAPLKTPEKSKAQTAINSYLMEIKSLLTNVINEDPQEGKAFLEAALDMDWRKAEESHLAEVVRNLRKVTIAGALMDRLSEKWQCSGVDRAAVFGKITRYVGRYGIDDRLSTIIDKPPRNMTAKQVDKMHDNIMSWLSDDPPVEEAPPPPALDFSVSSDDIPF